MPKITVTLDGVVINEFTLTKETTTLGRRPYNDIVLDNLTVSGEHAVLHMVGGRVTVEDLHSTNGTYIGGKAVKREELRNGDVLEMGKYRLKFETQSSAEAPLAAPPQEPTLTSHTTINAPLMATAPVTENVHGMIKVLSGPAAGREMALTKVVTTIGKPGVSVAAITQRRHSFFAHHVEGSDRMTINGETVGEDPCVLHHGDRIMLAGTEMQFLQA